MRRPGVVAGFFVLVAMGCAATRAPVPAPVADPARRFTGRGFSVGAPSGSQWMLVRRDAVYVEFAKDLGGQGLHMAKVFVATAESPGPLETAEALRAFVQETASRDFQEPRFSAVVTSVEPEPAAGAVCVRMRFVAEDRGVPYAMASVFALRGWQVVCIHPGAAGRGLVLVGASQRYLATGRPVDIEAEAEAVVRSLRFEPLG